jgi:hypothetical protein
MFSILAEKLGLGVLGLPATMRVWKITWPSRTALSV